MWVKEVERGESTGASAGGFQRQQNTPKGFETSAMDMRDRGREKIAHRQGARPPAVKMATLCFFSPPRMRRVASNSSLLSSGTNRSPGAEIEGNGEAMSIAVAVNEMAQRSAAMSAMDDVCMVGRSVLTGGI